MLLPKSGRVIIIDDKPHHATPLMSALSKQGVSSSYFDANKESLPLIKLSDARIVFLDINLNAGNPSWEAEKAALIINIKSILNPKTPYVLFVWSVNEAAQFEDVVKLFENELIDYKPIIPLIPMGKDKLFKLVDPEQDRWDLELGYDGTIKFIEDRITEGIAKMDSIEALIKWENLVAMSTTQVTNEIVSLASTKESLNEELKGIYYKLAEAMWGRQLSKDPSEITGKAISVFNHLLNDRLDFNVSSSLIFDLIKDIKSPEKFEEKDKAIFNSKLLLSFNNRTGAFPGNVYEHTGAIIDKPPFNGLIADSLLIPFVASEFYEIQNGKKPESPDAVRNFKVEKRKDYEAYEKKIREAIKSSSRFISLEVSPICDYAQKKWKLNRVCPAVLWSSDYIQYIGKSDNLYVSPLLYIEEKCFQLIIDLRYFSSFPFEIFKEAKPIFSLKHSFLIDIQSILSRHINRPGITALN